MGLAGGDRHPQHDPGRAIGGTRMRRYPAFEDAIEDALRLSHAMTAKATFAGMGCGGGKAVICGDPLRDKTPELLLAFGRAVDELAGRFFTGGDMGIDTADLAVMSGPPVHRPYPCDGGGGRVGLDRDRCRLGHGGRSPASRKAPFRLHCGASGARGGRRSPGTKLAGRGVDLIVTDTVPGRLDAVVRATETARWRRTGPTVGCDIFSPNAAGAVITNAVAGQLRCRAIVGPRTIRSPRRK